MQGFRLDPRLKGDSLPVAELTLSAVRLMRDANYPWLLLVPMRPGLAEVIDLGSAERMTLMDEIALACQALRGVGPCDKLNVAALGNSVRQLHVHVIARRTGDAAWPRPVWGHAAAVPYTPEAERALIAAIRERLATARETG